MATPDRYQIGTPEMIRKDREREERYERIARHRAFAPIMVGLIMAGPLAFMVYAMQDAFEQERAAYEAREQAQALLEQACTDKGGQMIRVGRGRRTRLCLANSAVLFRIEDEASETANAITGMRPEDFSGPLQ